MQSLPLMTAIDLVIMGCAVIATWIVRDLRHRVPRVGWGPVVVTAGFGLIAVFFALDLGTLWVLPAWIGDQPAQSLMMDLRLNWIWLVMLVAALALTFGIYETARALWRANKRLRGRVHDVTERNRALDRLQESEARYRSLVEDQTEFIVRWKPDGTRTFVNEAYCRYFGQTREELLGSSFAVLELAPAPKARARERAVAKVPERAATCVLARRCQEEGLPGALPWVEGRDDLSLLRCLPKSKKRSRAI